MKVVAIKDFYFNIKGKGKIKELTKGKEYEKIESIYFGKNDVFIINDLGESKLYLKKNMFRNIAQQRDYKLTQLGI
jgi:hypothetical protein